MANDFTISLGFDPKQFKEVERYLREYPEKMAQHVAESMNRAVAAMDTQIRRGISQRYQVTQKQIKAHSRSRKATARLLTASVTISDSAKSAWPMYDFKVNPRGVNPRRRRPLQISILRGKAETFRHAFIAKMKSGHEGVFEREKGAGRLPIKELFSVTPAVMASQSVVAAEVEKAGYATFEKRLTHAIDRMHQLDARRVKALFR